MFPVAALKELRIRLMHWERPTRAGGVIRFKLAEGSTPPSLCIVHRIAKMEKSIALLGCSNGNDFWGMFNDKARMIVCHVKTLPELVERASNFLAGIVLIEEHIIEEPPTTFDI